MNRIIPAEMQVMLIVALAGLIIITVKNTDVLTEIKYCAIQQWDIIKSYFTKNRY